MRPPHLLGRALAGALDYLLPRFCLGCAVPVPGAQPDAVLHLCGGCRRRLRPLDLGRACRGCLHPLPGGRDPAARCGSCRRDPPPWERVVAAWEYRPPLDAVVRALKFRRLDFLGGALAAAALAQGLAGALAGPDLVVPMPLPWPRRLARGFNQAERIARPLAGALGLPLAELLARPGWAPRQTRRGGPARRRIPPGSFRVPAPGRLGDRHVLLVDDVLTTGSTARAAAACLRTAGAGAVTVCALAWTPPGALAGLLDSPCTRS
jgi:ComF family protein